MKRLIFFILATVLWQVALGVLDGLGLTINWDSLILVIGVPAIFTLIMFKWLENRKIWGCLHKTKHD